MSFPDLKSKVLQQLPGSLQALNGGLSASSTSPATGFAPASIPATSAGTSVGLPAANAGPAQSPDVPEDARPKVIPVNLLERWTSKLSERFQAGKLGLHHIFRPENRPATSGAGKPARPVGESRPGSSLKPMTVDEMLARMPKAPKPPTPRFTITPEEIRYSPSRAEQDSLQRQVFALPWNDEDVFNPFHTGPCNVTD